MEKGEEENVRIWVVIVRLFHTNPNTHAHSKKHCFETLCVCINTALNALSLLRMHRTFIELR